MVSNLELTKRAIDGDDEAFLQLMFHYKVDLFKTAIAFLKNEEDAIEAIQEVTYRSYKNLSSIREPAYFKTWLIRIMINYCNDELAKRKNIILNNELLEKKEVIDDDISLQLEEAMVHLDDRSREILTLKYFHGLKIKEIAKTFECPEGTIKTRLYKALRRLREILDEKGRNEHV